MPDVTQILEAIESGDTAAADKLLPLVYEELRRLAGQRMFHESPGQTIDATALVHEAYLRLVGGDKPQQWNGRGHFFGAAAEAMRRILVERARRKCRIRHGGHMQRVEIPDVADPSVPDEHTILAVDEALAELAKDDPEAAEVVKLHFFAGLTLEETAKGLGVSRATVYRRWSYARACLRVSLGELVDRGEAEK